MARRVARAAREAPAESHRVLVVRLLNEPRRDPPVIAARVDDATLTIPVGHVHGIHDLRRAVRECLRECCIGVFNVNVVSNPHGRKIL